MRSTDNAVCSVITKVEIMIINIMYMNKNTVSLCLYQII